jgi:hypothetical protein
LLLILGNRLRVSPQTSACILIPASSLSQKLLIRIMLLKDINNHFLLDISYSTVTIVSILSQAERNGGLAAF